ncbi:MAG: cobyric acid synthase CobQ [Rhodospirillales bacterium]|nr:cobyric acid synthase CobQ [Rhodospirillales bacterium]
MLQGTGSDVGKSLLVAGLARALTRRGYAVRPFKPQNMSNNAAVTPDGGEIGRAQALQARACGVPPATDMNPVLLKPQSETGAQIIVQGRVFGSAGARDYHALKRDLMPRVLESFQRLSAPADIILVEGAGSPAEVNLRQSDIANMGFAEAADVPVVLVGDIDRGGVIASLIGTHALLTASEQARLKGYVVNKFRGDPGLFTPALDVIRARTGLECLGIVKFFAAARDLPAEDGLALDGYGRARRDGRIRIAVPLLPRIANFDDLDPLAAENEVALDLVSPGRALPGDADLVLLPGSKATLADLASLREAGWDIDIAAHVRRGGRVLGLCAGYQMLGRRIADPDGIEGKAGEAAGLGLLDVETVLGPAKILRERTGSDRATGEMVRGYEMHLGTTSGAATARPMLELDDGAARRPEGASSPDGLVAGCYLHGLFASDEFRAAFLGDLGGSGTSGLRYETRIETVLDALAAHLERDLDIDRLIEIAHAR